MQNLIDTVYVKLLKFNFVGFVVEFLVKKTKKPIIFKSEDGSLFLQEKDDPITLNYARRNVSDSTEVINVINSNVKHGWTCIDIGACIGAISVPLWKKVGEDGRVFSIEADPNNIHKIKVNLLLNGFNDNDVFNYAVCDKNKRMTLNVIEGDNGWQSLGESKTDNYMRDKKINKIRVDGIRLDDFCHNNRIDKIDLLKIDVEGAELEVLKGASGLLKNNKVGRVVFELSPRQLGWFNRSEDDVLNYLKMYGFVIYKINPDGTIKKCSNSELHNQFCNCLAIRK